MRPEDGYLAAGRPECAAGAYSLMGYKWTSTLRWRINLATRPANLSADGVVGALRKAVQNITNQAIALADSEGIPSLAMTVIGTGYRIKPRDLAIRPPLVAALHRRPLPRPRRLPPPRPRRHGNLIRAAAPPVVSSHR